MAKKVSSISQTTLRLFLDQLDFKLTSFQYAEAIFVDTNFLRTRTYEEKDTDCTALQ